MSIAPRCTECVGPAATTGTGESVYSVVRVSTIVAIFLRMLLKQLLRCVLVFLVAATIIAEQRSLPSDNKGASDGSHHAFSVSQSNSHSLCFRDDILSLRGGSYLIPSGWNPLGYKITSLGEEFLSYEGSLDSDVGRLLASLKKRKSTRAIKDSWLEIVRVSKKGQSMRIYRMLDDLLQFCLKAGLID